MEAIKKEMWENGPKQSWMEEKEHVLILKILG